jgi:hypothetical protein
VTGPFLRLSIIRMGTSSRLRRQACLRLSAAPHSLRSQSLIPAAERQWPSARETIRPQTAWGRLRSVSIGWSIFDGFTPPAEPPLLSWEHVAAWTAHLESQLGAERKLLAKRRASSDAALEDLGGDPTASDWTNFLPIRRDREEDWSDWLAQLFEESTTGQFAWALLGGIEGRPRNQYIRPAVHREVFCAGYRADLIVHWADSSSYTHIEVKVGDPHLAKTLQTSLEVEKHFLRGRSCRSDIVLLLPTQIEAWTRACSGEPDMHDRVRSLTWLDVAKALRSALPLGVGETLRWRVWAHAFCGAIEQGLLAMRSAAQPDDWSRTLGLKNLQDAAVLFDLKGEEPCSIRRRS